MIGSSRLSSNAPGRLIYGAFNWTSSTGAAPAYSPTRWLEIPIGKVVDSLSFTRRDSYVVTLPFLSDYAASIAQERLRLEILCARGVYDACLERFWTIQQTTWSDYIEAQIWRPLLLEDVRIFHLREDIYRDAEEFFASFDGGPKAWNTIRDRVRTFPLPAILNTSS